jgi:hypothetical protein
MDGIDIRGKATFSGNVALGNPPEDGWSVMAIDPTQLNRWYAFSMEGLSTIDTQEVPSRD